MGVVRCCLNGCVLLLLFDVCCMLVCIDVGCIVLGYRCLVACVVCCLRLLRIVCRGCVLHVVVLLLCCSVLFVVSVGDLVCRCLLFGV